MAEISKIKVGELAPSFVAESSSGAPIDLEAFRGRSEVILFFYPKDNSPACTLEACSFRDNYEAFVEAGAQVIGVSGDTEKSHQGFASRFQLPFPLISDRDGAIRKRFGIRKTFGIFPGRVTFLIDREGVIRQIFSSQFEPWKHIPETLKMLKTLRDEGK